MQTHIKLARWRTKHGMSQKELADSVGCARQYIGLLESGLRKAPGLAVALGIERATDGEVKAAEWLRR